MDYEPIAVGLKFGFIAVLYLFLLWIARSALKDLRRTASPAPDATGLHGAVIGSAGGSSEDAWLVAERGGGIKAGSRFDLFGGLSIGRSADADVQIDDRYASGLHQAALLDDVASPSEDAWLVVQRGGGLKAGARYDLFGGLSIGRSGEADVQIDDRYASGLHARIYAQRGNFYVEDLKSTNGTLLNDAALAGEAELVSGDLIRIGDTEFRFEPGG